MGRPIPRPVAMETAESGWTGSSRCRTISFRKVYESNRSAATGGTCQCAERMIPKGTRRPIVCKRKNP